MTLVDLELYGATLNAGYADIYHEGKHLRLAEVLPGGELRMLPDGDAFVQGFMFEQQMEVITGPDSAPADPPASPVPAKKVTAKKVAAKKEAPPAEAPPAEGDDLAALDALIGEDSPE